MKKPSKKELIVRDAFLKNPTKSDNDIAKITGVSQPSVSQYRKKYDLEIDAEFIAIVAGKFISDYGKARDHWLSLIDEIEENKHKTKTVVLIKDGKSVKAEIPLEPMEILAMEKEQANLREKILYLAGQGEVREIIRIMRAGTVPKELISNY